MNNKKGKAIAEHFYKLKSKVEDFRFMPFLKIWSENPHVILHLEKYYINKYNLVDGGINMIL